MKKFEDLKYLGQVRRLRKLAELSLKQYKLKPVKIKFIHHGENTTFKVITKSNSYLLRVHRSNYHKPASLNEELRWLNYINKKKFAEVQIPIKNKSNKLVTSEEYLDLKRNISVLSWVEGKIIGHNYNLEHLYKMGGLLATMHKKGADYKCKHRVYWDHEGLLGKNSSFSHYSTLEDELSVKQFEKLKTIYKKLNSLLKRYDRKSNTKGYIHADLHLFNIVWQDGEPIPIDFDDCGYGYFMYDIAVVCSSALNKYKKVTPKAKLEVFGAILDGYRSVKPLSEKDKNMVDVFVNIRTFVMFCWLYDRRDNPRLYAYFKKSINKEINKLYKLMHN